MKEHGSFAAILAVISYYAGCTLGLPVSANGVCENALHPQANPSNSTVLAPVKDVGWCRLHEQGPSGETVYIFTDQRHAHPRPRHVFVSYNRSQAYTRYLLDCESGTISQFTSEQKSQDFKPVSTRLQSEIYASVCTEDNKLITKPMDKDVLKWPAPPLPPPLSL
jgi:hypothetical protein